MIDLSKVDIKVLEKEISNRKYQNEYDKFNKVNKKLVKQFEITTELSSKDSEIYLVEVLDGCEGWNVIISDSTKSSIKELTETIKALVTKSSEPYNCDWHIQGINIEKINQYGLEIIKIL